MKVIIDTNRIIASLIKDGMSRKILFTKDFEFLAPEHCLSEIKKYEKEIIRKARITYGEFAIILSLIFERIKIIPKAHYLRFLEESKKLILDKDDSPFIALYLSSGANAIWSDDKHFQEQNNIRVFRTKEMSRLV